MKVVSILVVDVTLVGGIPVGSPVSRVRIHQHERIPAVRETRIPHIHDRKHADAEEVLAAEIEIVAVLRDVVAAVASALCPATMVGGPVPAPVLLPGSVSLPTALPCPSTLLLPRLRYCPGALRLLLLLTALLRRLLLCLLSTLLQWLLSRLLTTLL